MIDAIKKRLPVIGKVEDDEDKRYRWYGKREKLITKIRNLAKKQWDYKCPCCGSPEGYLQQVSFVPVQDDLGILSAKAHWQATLWRYQEYRQGPSRIPAPDTLGLICPNCKWERDSDEESADYNRLELTGPNGTDLTTFRNRWKEGRTKYCWNSDEWVKNKCWAGCC